MLLTERFADRIQLVLSCFDRMVFTGTLIDFGHARAATRELYRRQIRIFDFPQFANTLRRVSLSTTPSRGGCGNLGVHTCGNLGVLLHHVNVPREPATDVSRLKHARPIEHDHELLHGAADVGTWRLS
jgi:hypothetical protein